MMDQSESRVERLASRLEAVNRDVMQACEACTDEDWQLKLDEDERPVGVIFHHIAIGYDIATEWARQIAAGESPPELGMEQIHDYNAQHARQVADVSREETLVALKESTAKAAKTLRGLTEKELGKRSARPLFGVPNIKAGSLFNAAAIEHARGHLSEIQAALSRRS
jgi:uncharacterized damage-inducible protein DinB